MAYNKIRPDDIFSSLTIIKDSKKRSNGDVVWLCKCICGNLIETLTKYLRQGHKKCCGCQTPRIKVGDVFTNLTVVEETTKRARRAKIWLCNCICGNTIEVRTDYLQQQWSKSCGCLKSEMARDKIAKIWGVNPKKNQTIEVYKLNALIRTYKEGAKNRSIAFGLSDIQIYQLVILPCHYCNYVPNRNTASNISYVYSDYFNGIDRMESNCGYTIDNVVPCCTTCNIGKNSMTYVEFIKYLDRICLFRGKVV